MEREVEILCRVHLRLASIGLGVVQLWLVWRRQNDTTSRFPNRLVTRTTLQTIVFRAVLQCSASYNLYRVRIPPPYTRQTSAFRWSRRGAAATEHGFNYS